MTEGLLYKCPNCSKDVQKIPHEFVNYYCKNCEIKWTITNLTNMSEEVKRLAAETFEGRIDELLKVAKRMEGEGV